MSETPSIRSGDPVFSFDENLVIQSWNEAAEHLTGIPAEEAVGAPCWLVLGARSPRGDLVCHAGCSNARLAREGWPVSSQDVTIPDPCGSQSVSLATVRVQTGDRPLFLHLMSARTSEEEPVDDEEPAYDYAPALTARQRQILKLVSEGRGARSIAAELRLAESTVRNHIRGVLVAFAAHSQLEAVAKARAAGVLDRR